MPRFPQLRGVIEIMLRLAEDEVFDGKYRLDARIAVGGMGVVWAARRIKTDCEVAIKIALDPSASPEQLRRRWQREVQTLSKLTMLNDPRVVELLDFGFDPVPYLVMKPFLHNLDRHLNLTRHQRLGVDVKLGWLRQILLGVQAVHRAGFAHGDVKPANVLVQSDPDNDGYRFAVSDFGLAKCRGATFGHSRDWGTLAYTAPELFASLEESTESIDAGAGDEDAQAEDAGTQLDEEDSVVTSAMLEAAKRADVYALGVVAYKIFSERLPCEETTEGAVLEWHDHEFADPKPLVRADVPRDIADFIAARVLHKDPERRPTLDEFIDLLERRPNQQPVSVVATGPLRGSAREPRQIGVAPQRTLRRGLIATGLLGIATAAVVVSFGATRFRPSAMTTSAAIGSMSKDRKECVAPLHTVHIGGGTFWRGASVETIDRDCSQMPIGASCDRDKLDRVSPPQLVTVTAFDIARYELTNAEAAWSCNRIDCQPFPEDQPDKDAPPHRYGHGPDGTRWFDMGKRDQSVYYDDASQSHWKVQPGKENLPFVGLTWDGAIGLCKDQGGRPATEAEWELAAAGIEHRSLPWATDPLTCERANIARDPHSEDGAKTAVCATAGLPHLKAVGSSAFDRTPEGLFDMAGNAAEWVVDNYSPKYPACNSPCVDPVTKNDTGLHVFRGGGWAYPPEKALTYYRTELPGTKMRSDITTRCVFKHQETKP